jgi:hypothetical protein
MTDAMTDVSDARLSELILAHEGAAMLRLIKDKDSSLPDEITNALRELQRRRASDDAKDAARYRWLRTRINWCDRERTFGDLSCSQREWTHIDYRRDKPDSEHIDEYIDSSMGAEHG